MNDMNDMSKDEVFAALRTKGITKVEVSFSGGNDEGGADEITATLADGTTKSLLGSHSVWTEWKSQQIVVGYGDTMRPATPEEIAEASLSDSLEAPIYAQWGGFGGDFSVSGNLVWDVTSRTAAMDYEESVQSYESHHRDL